MKFDYEIYKKLRTTKTLKIIPDIRLYIKHEKKVENRSLNKILKILVKTTTTKTSSSSKLKSHELFISIKFQSLFPWEVT